MGVPLIHPSQRRVSCESCRKHKARCQRPKRDEPKCARCTLLDLECITGQQRSIGRPRRTAASASVPTPSSAVQRRRPKKRSEAMPPRKPREKALDWNSRTSPASSSKVISNTVDNEVSEGATWPTMCISSLDQYPPSWDSGLEIPDGEFMFAHSTSFDVLSSSLYTPYLHTPNLYTPNFGIYPTSPSNSASCDPGFSLTTMNPRQMAMPGIADGTDDATALIELSKMNVDLHMRVAAAETNRDNLEFNNVIYQQGALYIDGLTLAEFILKTCQSFLKLLTKLLSTRQPPGQPRTSPTADALSTKPSTLQSPPEHASQALSDAAGTVRPLPAPVALVITSVLTQLLSLYELMLHHFTARVKWVSFDPIPPIPGVTFDGVSLDNPCSQGILFSIHLLERIECALGISSLPGAHQVGLLSARQKEVLWSELDSRSTLSPGHTVRRPALLRRLFGNLAVMFRQTSAASLQT
ncbi:hypothetical protein PWT90_06490 [Aphanocladium album]|nr:hypothetical protein PWT90_06490 [Aphanocladium album]